MWIGEENDAVDQPWIIRKKIDDCEEILIFMVSCWSGGICEVLYLYKLLLHGGYGVPEKKKWKQCKRKCQ